MKHKIRTSIINGRIWRLSEPMEKAYAEGVCKKYRQKGYEATIVGGATKRSWVVYWCPTEPEAMQEMKDNEQAKRAATAYLAFRLLEWSDKQGETWVRGDDSWYRVSEHACSCADYQQRCLRVGIKCKHIIALEIRLGTKERSHAPRPHRTQIC